MSDSHFEPELGQFMFGQPSQWLSAPVHLGWALGCLMDAWDVARDEDNPFGNFGTGFKGAHIEVESYSWSDEEQPYNLAWRDVRISWYKHARRGVSVNRSMTVLEIAQLLRDGMADVLSTVPHASDSLTKRDTK